MLRLCWDHLPPGTPLTRREWLRLGSWAGLPLLGTGGLLSSATAARAADAASRREFAGFGRAKAVIVIVASGGQSQIDTWDPKPDAPEEIRGAFSTIRTAVPGCFFSEHMPQIARIADKLTVLRTMSHEDLDHGSAFYLMMTGQYHNRRSSNPPPQPTDHPGFGSVYKRLRPKGRFVQPLVHLNGPAQVPIVLAPGQYGGFLGRDYDALTIGDVTAGEIVIPGLDPHPELPLVRLDARQRLVESLDAATRRLESDRSMADMQQIYRQAFEMLEKPTTHNAFKLSAEPVAVRDRYGRNRSGQACLLARRLVEAGVPVVTVFFNHTNRGQDRLPDQIDEYGWDTHNDIFLALQEYLLPRFDQAFSTLIEDLEERGMLDETLVVCQGEFGRAPLVALEPRFAGSSPGRKHWASVYSIALAGAGVGRGLVVGQSDSAGAYPKTERYGPWDVTATIFSALGIDPRGHFTDSTGRPYSIASGRPIEAIYSG